MEKNKLTLSERIERIKKYVADHDNYVDTSFEGNYPILDPEDCYLDEEGWHRFVTPCFDGELIPYDKLDEVDVENIEEDLDLE